MPLLTPDIEFAERGQGPALLFLPGSFGTGAGWRSVIDALGGGYRIVTTSLLGYGATAERRPLGNASMQQQVEVLDAIVERIGVPPHVIGHSFGGLCALALAMQGARKVASLSLVEANPFEILRTAGDDALHAMFGAMTDVYFAEFEAGRSDAARHVIDFYGGAGTFDGFPPKVRDYVVATTATNIRDWTSARSFQPLLADFRAIRAPTFVIRGGKGHPAMLRIAELLAANIPVAEMATIAGGSHFLPMTHADEVACLIAAQVARVGA
jgi:pimeloyl-ACP methyl ester carboxylesterase